MAAKQWYVLKIKRPDTGAWEVVMKVKSVGLASHAHALLVKIYGEGCVISN